MTKFTCICNKGIDTRNLCFPLSKPFEELGMIGRKSLFWRSEENPKFWEQCPRRIETTTELITDTHYWLECIEKNNYYMVDLPEWGLSINEKKEVKKGIKKMLKENSI